MPAMTPRQARSIKRPRITVGEMYEFYAEMSEEYKPPEERMRNYTGQRVTVIKKLASGDVRFGGSYIVRTEDGSEFIAMQEELNGWDRDLGQYFWPDGTYGPNHETLSA